MKVLTTSHRGILDGPVRALSLSAEAFLRNKAGMAARVARYAVVTLFEIVHATVITTGTVITRIGSSAAGANQLLDPKDMADDFGKVFRNLDLLGQALVEPVLAFADPLNGLLGRDPQTTCKKEVVLNHVLRGSLKVYGIAAKSCMARPPEGDRVYMCEFEDPALCNMYMPYHGLQINPMCSMGGFLESLAQTAVSVVQLMVDHGIYFFSGLANCAMSDGTDCSFRGMPRYPHAAVDLLFCNGFEVTVHFSNVFGSFTRIMYSWVYDVANYDEKLGGSDVPNCVGLPEAVCVTRGIGFFEDYLYPHAKPCKRSGGCFCAWIKQKTTSDRKAQDFCASACSLVLQQSDCGQVDTRFDPLGQCEWRDGRCMSHRDNLQKYPIEASINTFVTSILSFPLHAVHIANKTFALALDPGGDEDQDASDVQLVSPKSLKAPITNLRASASQLKGQLKSLNKEKLKGLRKSLTSKMKKPPAFGIDALLKMTIWYRDMLVAFLELVRAFDVVTAGVQSSEFETFQLVIVELVDIVQQLAFTYKDFIVKTVTDAMELFMGFMELLTNPKDALAILKKIMMVLLDYIAAIADLLINFVRQGELGKAIDSAAVGICKAVNVVSGVIDLIVGEICNVLESLPSWLGIKKPDFCASDRGDTNVCNEAGIEFADPLLPAAEASVCSVSVTPRDGVTVNLADVGASVKGLFDLVQTSELPEYGKLGCEWCVVTHPDQCQSVSTERDTLGQRTYDPEVNTNRGMACPCEFCAHKPQPNEPWDFMSASERDAGTDLEHEIYHCNAATGYCQCGPAPGQLLTEARLPVGPDRVREDVICPGGRSLRQVDRKDHLTAAYKTHNAMCYIREAWRCDVDRLNGASYYWTDPVTNERRKVLGENHLTSPQCRSVRDTYCDIIGGASGRAACKSDEAGVARDSTRRRQAIIEQTRCAVHRCLTYSRDVELEGPYLCREFCDPHPFNEDNVLNEAYYRWGELSDQPELVHWRFDKAPFQDVPNNDKTMLEELFGIHDTALERCRGTEPCGADTDGAGNLYASMPNDNPKSWNRQADIWNRAKVEAQDERLSAYCVCDVGYRDTPVSFNENLIPSGEETTGYSPGTLDAMAGYEPGTAARTATEAQFSAAASNDTVTLGIAEQVGQGAPPLHYLFMGRGEDAFAHLRRAGGPNVEFTAGRRRRQLLEERRQTPWADALHGTGCTRDVDCRNGTAVCLTKPDGDDLRACDSCGARQAAMCDAAAATCVCGRTSRALAPARHQHPDKERERTAKDVQALLRTSFWTGSTGCDRLMRGYIGQRAVGLGMMELLEMHKCARLRMAGMQLAEVSQVPGLPQDLFYNPWTALGLMRDAAYGTVIYAQSPDRDAARTQIRSRGIDPVLILKLVDFCNWVIASVADAQSVQDAVDADIAPAIESFIGPEAGRVVRDAAARGVRLAEEADRDGTLERLRGLRPLKATAAALSIIADRAAASGAAPRAASVQVPAPVVVSNTETAVPQDREGRRLQSEQTVATARAEEDSLDEKSCALAQILVDNTVDAFKYATTYYTDIYPLQVCMFMKEFTSVFPKENVPDACDDVKIEAYKRPSSLLTAEPLWKKWWDSLSRQWSEWRGRTDEAADAPPGPAPRAGAGDKSTTAAFVKGLEALSGLDVTGRIDVVLAGLLEDSAQSAAESFQEYYVCKMEKIWDPAAAMNTDTLSAIIGAAAIITAGTFAWKQLIGVGQIWISLAGGAAFLPVIMFLLYDTEAGCAVEHPNAAAAIPVIGQLFPATLPFVPTRLADDLYTVLDDTILPEGHPVLFDRIASRHDTDGTIAAVADCAADPYGFNDGFRIVAYWFARAYPEWRTDIPHWLLVIAQNTPVDGLLGRYDKRHLQRQTAGDLRPTMDDCAYVSAFVHLPASIFISAVILAVVPAVIVVLIKVVALLPLSQASALRWLSYDARQLHATIYEAAEGAAQL